MGMPLTPASPALRGAGAALRLCFVCAGRVRRPCQLWEAAPALLAAFDAGSAVYRPERALLGAVAPSGAAAFAAGGATKLGGQGQQVGPPFAHCRREGAIKQLTSKKKSEAKDVPLPAVRRKAQALRRSCEACVALATRCELRLGQRYGCTEIEI